MCLAWPEVSLWALSSLPPFSAATLHVPARWTACCRRGCLPSICVFSAWATPSARNPHCLPKLGESLPSSILTSGARVLPGHLPTPLPYDHGTQCMILCVSSSELPSRGCVHHPSSLPPTPGFSESAPSRCLPNGCMK